MANFIFTTPEKWDSTTRRWRDNRFLVQSVKLFLIDEIHVVNDKNRGATVEAVTSRMMTIHSDFNLKLKPDIATKNSIRFVAVSATIPNVEDLAKWFGYGNRPSVSYRLGEEYRPVKLKKIVLGYPRPKNCTDFRFDMMLSYKLLTIINKYSEGKQSLVFCSTRKGVMQTASVVVNEAKLIVSTQLKQKLRQSASTVRDGKLKDFLCNGVGSHHAGLDYHDRKIVEELFIRGELPILIATTTLAMGVNLPAHLVIIKSTTYYENGQFVDYNDTQLLQMIGRAGRPQFDTSATAVIMTKDYEKAKYEKLINGTQIIESSLHKKLAEYLNVEIVLKTITDLAVAMQWIRSTLLYVRILRNPTHYGLPSNLSKHQIEQKLQEMCVKELNSLAAAKLIQMDEYGFDLKSTEAGRLMAHYCVSLNTMKRFGNVKGNETISDLLQVISASEEFCEVQLRTSEKRTLNALNKDKHQQTIRFPMNGRIQNREMKINCLVQAAFGCISIQDWTLSQETIRILRTGQRLSKCLSECIGINHDFKLVVSSILLAKCFRARLWENSKHVGRQLEKIGNTLSNNLVNSGLTTFQKIEEANPRQLELIMNRHPPFGSHVRDAVINLPKYVVAVEQIPKYTSTTADVNVTVMLTNFQQLKEDGTRRTNPCVMLIIGNKDNKIIFKQRIVHFLTHETAKWSKSLNVRRAQNGHELIINLINEQYAGLDVRSSFTPYYIGGKNIAIKQNVTISDAKTDDLRESSSEIKCENVSDSQRANQRQWQIDVQKERRKCGHHCLNKATCAHQCCKVGVNVKTSWKSSKATSSSAKTTKLSQSMKVQKEQTKKMLSNTMLKFCADVKNKSQALPVMGSSRTFSETSPNVEITDKPTKACKVDMKQFEYKADTNSNVCVTNCNDIDDSWADDVDDSYFDFELPVLETETDNSPSRKLKATSQREAQNCSFSDDNFNEIVKEKDDDVVLLYDGSNHDFYGDWPEMTAEDFQNDPLKINGQFKRPDLDMRSFDESSKFPTKRKLLPKFEVRTELFSSHKMRRLPSAKNAGSKLKLGYSETTTDSVRNFQTEFVSESAVGRELLLDNSEKVGLDHQLTCSLPSCYGPKLSTQMPVAKECDFEASNVDPRRIITADKMKKNPELQEAVKTFCDIFGDLF